MESSEWAKNRQAKYVKETPTVKLKQMPLTIKFKKLHEDATTPSYARAGDAGLDLVAITAEIHDSYIEYGTGLSFEIPDGYAGFLYPRSSITKSARGVSMKNSVGVIDAGYRGEVKVRLELPAEEAYWDGESFVVWRDGEDGPLTNGLDDRVSTPVVGDKIAQLIIMPIPTVELIEVDELSDTERGDGGFGSTDEKDVLQARGF